MFNIINDIFLSFFRRIVDSLPALVSGILILSIGIVLSSILKKILRSLFSFFRLATILEKMKMMSKGEVKVWEEILAEILRWTIIVLFLIPTFDIWGLSRATAVLNQFILYLPNVIIAVIVGFIGIIASNKVAEIVKRGISTIDSVSAKTLSLLTKWFIIFFTVLIVLNQLGVAQDLIRILFTGIVAMVSLAGGLAFGLGGKDVARELLEELRKKISQK